MTDKAIVLTGLDGANPLGFFAALGTLASLDDRATAEQSVHPRLSWTDRGRWLATLHGPQAVDEIINTIMRDKAEWTGNPVIDFAYDKEGNQFLPPAGKGAVQDLKPQPALMHVLLDDLAERAARGDRRSADTIAGLATDVATDNAGKVKPTAFHFTAGQQQFLKMVAELQTEVDKDLLREALVGPWQGESKLPSLAWNASQSRQYALRASDPSKEKKGSVAGAYWLGFLGQRFFALAAHGSKALSPGVTGGWKNSHFTWPVWSPPLRVTTVNSLLRLPELVTMGPNKRTEYGIERVFRSFIHRSDQGGYGSFSPAQVM
jgi:hypothetical protein